MENAYEALIMAGAAILFIMGISVAVYNYSKVMEINDKILTNSEYYDRTAENFQLADYYTVNDGLNDPNTMQRIYKSEEIARMILNMYEVKDTEVMVESASYDQVTGATTTNTFKTKDIAWDEITVNDTYKADSYKFYRTSPQLNSFNALIRDVDGEYKVSSTSYTLDSSKGIITSRKVVFERTGP